MRVFMTGAILSAVLLGPAWAQSSNAAAYLADREISDACEGGGSIAPQGLIERDLTGDGRADLIVAHQWIRCASGGRSLQCGAQVCSVRIYVREGDLLQLNAEMLGANVEVGSGSVPRIFMHAHGGARGSVIWDGARFVR